MRQSFSITLFAAVLILTLSLPEIVIAGEDLGTTDLAADLRATEEAFARTMADRDHQAFVSFLAEETVFFGRRGEIRGREAVAAAWKPLYEGHEAPFSWKPETATVLDSGTLGLTSGPIFASSCCLDILDQVSLSRIATVHQREKDTLRNCVRGV